MLHDTGRFFMDSKALPGAGGANEGNDTGRKIRQDSFTTDKYVIMTIDFVCITPIRELPAAIFAREMHLSNTSNLSK